MSIMENKETEDRESSEGCNQNGNKDKADITHEETKNMEFDEINLNVDQEDETEEKVDGRCSLLKDRKRLQDILHSHKFQTAIIVFVVLDFLIVLVQLLMDIQVIKGVQHGHVGIEILHYASIVILGLFLVEIAVKIYAFSLEFFHHKLEVFDAVVVIISFALDVAYSGNADAWDAIGLLVLLRLWRIVRIANGIVLSVKIEMDEKIHHLKEEINNLEKELQHYKNKCEEQEVEIKDLEAKLKS